jgi:hypothetical protein
MAASPGCGVRAAGSRSTVMELYTCESQNKQRQATHHTAACHAHASEHAVWAAAASSERHRHLAAQSKQEPRQRL